tara:strand:- start:313 stop:630 length:318 start_codon:yes stop_codon:yes gene_type:complete
MKKKTCDICKGDIQPVRDEKNGKVIWSDGHNAQPILDGRCCDECNSYVLALRLKQMNMRDELDAISRWDARVTIDSLSRSVIQRRREDVKNSTNKPLEWEIKHNG